MSAAERARVVEAIEAALRVGQGRVSVFVDGHSRGGGDPTETREQSGWIPASAGMTAWRFSTDLHCANCDIHYADPTPARFSFNSPIGACDTCRGFGRVIGIDYGLIIPDESKSLRAGAVKPFQTKSYDECQDDIEKFAPKRGIPLDVPYRALSAEQKRWVMQGDDDWVSWKKSGKTHWYGVKRFFDWL